MKEENVLFMRRFATMAVGNMMEWFDFSSFGALVDIMAVNFFPQDSNSSGISSFLNALVIFGVAFLMRPLGGIFMGWIGDTIGRKKALEMSILLMMVPSFLIGCLPTYQQVGWISTAILVILRSLQGLAAGGEIVGAFIFTMEAAKGKNLGFWGGACKATGILGNAMGVGLVAILRWSLSHAAMNSWGWRVPFWTGFAIGIIGLMARRSLTLDAVHLHGSHGKTGSPISALLSLYKRNILQVIFVASFWGCGYYSSFVWLAYFLEKNELLGGVDNTWLIMFLANIFLVFALPFGGSIGDYLHTIYGGAKSVGWKLAMQGATILMIVTAIPAFLLIITKLDYCVMFGIILLAISVSIYGGSLPAFMNYQFPYELRYTGIGMSYNLSNAIFASTTSLIQTKIVLLHTKGDRDRNGIIFNDNRLRPAYYLMCISVVAFVSLMFSTEPSHSTVSTTEDPAVAENDTKDISETVPYYPNDHIIAMEMTENPLFSKVHEPLCEVTSAANKENNT